MNGRQPQARQENHLLRQARAGRGWTLDTAAERLRQVAIRLGETAPPVDKNMFSRWERGVVQPGPRYSRLLALLYDRSPQDLDLPGWEQVEGSDRVSATMDLVRSAYLSDVDPSALGTVDRAVDRLCRSYSTTPPAVLLPRVQQRLWQFHRYLASKLTIAQHRHITEAGAWLYLLLAALHYDLGEREAAESSRDMAMHFGTEAANPEIQAWSFETAAYFSLHDRPREAVDLAAAGAATAPEGTHAFVATSIQEARGWARLRDRRQAEQALSRSLTGIEHLPPIDNPQHHYVFDPPKFNHYAHTMYAWLGMPRQAERYARQAIKDFADPASRNHWPVRVAAARLALALALVQQRRVDEATAMGIRAFTDAPFIIQFQLRRGAELSRALDPYSELPEVDEFRERLAVARAATGDRVRINW